MPMPADAAEKQTPPVIVALGDSLTQGHRVPLANSYPSLLQGILQKNGYPHKVVNAGVSGDTTAGGARRIYWLMRQKPDWVILALGANDGLRGIPVTEIYANLESIIQLCLKNKVRVLFTGMKIPPNYGEEYSQDFELVFQRLAKKYQLPFIPFFLEGVAGDKELTHNDGIHPRVKGYEIVVQTVWKHLQLLLSKKPS